jgi:hypothetical protein
MSCTWFAIFPDVRRTDTPAECWLSQGFQHDMAAGARVCAWHLRAGAEADRLASDSSGWHNPQEAL